MKNIHAVISPVILLLLISFITPALAEPHMLYTYSRIRFITGGIGHDEVVEMRSVAKKHTLNLLFSEGKIGRAVTDLDVDIYNEQNEHVFNLKHAKPILYVNLPAGNYMILANNNGVTLRHRFAIAENKTQKIILNWKDEVEEDALTEAE